MMIAMTGVGDLSVEHNFVLPLRDADVIEEALRKALEGASPQERPGLERAVALVEAVAAETDGRLRARWARDRLAAAGFTGDVAAVAAVKALRREEPRLLLLAAAELQKDLLAHPE